MICLNNYTKMQIQMELKEQIQMLHNKLEQKIMEMHKVMMEMYMMQIIR